MIDALFKQLFHAHVAILAAVLVRARSQTFDNLPDEGVNLVTLRLA